MKTIIGLALILIAVAITLIAGALIAASPLPANVGGTVFLLVGLVVMSAADLLIKKMWGI